jgi:hypothetical protein
MRINAWIWRQEWDKQRCEDKARRYWAVLITVCVMVYLPRYHINKVNQEQTLAHQAQKELPPGIS